MTDRNNLPRSIRWRLQLGLLQDDPLFLQGKESNNSNNELESYLSSLNEYNRILVNEQRSLFEQLCDKHYRQSSALSIINDMENNYNQQQSTVRLPPKKPSQSTSTSGTSTGSKDISKKSLKIVSDDPLSIIATMEEERVKIDKMNIIERKKNMALASRMHKKQQLLQQNSSSELIDSTDSKANVQECLKGSKTRWDEFYSSKEVMDIIKKDLDRLPLNHHHYYHQRKKGISTYSQVEDASLTKSREDRSFLLAKILFVYAREHSIGYRQGMHEILSFVMMAVEKDLLTRDLTERVDKPEMNTEDEYLLNDTKIIHDTYTIFNTIMASLLLAFGHYDEKTNDTKAHPTERTGDATVRIIREWQGDDLLADFLMGLDVPPELYCTRWIRLMFSREVSNLDDAFTLWDTFFHELDNGDMTLINILETAAASMIILIRDKLLPLQNQYSYHDGYGSFNNMLELQKEYEYEQEHEPMELLMNYPQIKDTSALLQTYSVLIMNQKHGIKPVKIQQQEPYLDHQMANYHGPSGTIDPEPPLCNTIHSTFYAPDSHISDQLNQPYLNDGDQIMATLKNLQNNPALKKLSTSLNAVKGAAKDALLSLDRQMKPQDHFKSPESPLHSSLKPGPHHSTDLSFPVYRDLRNVQTIFDGTSPSVRYDSNKSGSDLNVEDQFINRIPSKTKSPMKTKSVTGEKVPLSQELSERINRCVMKLSKSLEAAKIPHFASNDVRDVMTELDSIRLDIESKYDIFSKHNDIA